MTSARIHERFSMYNDWHYSQDLFVAYRTGLTYHPKKDNLVTTIAYAYLKLSTPFSDGDLVRSEHRPWMQIIYRVPSTKRLRASFRFKYDARFIQDLNTESLAETYSFNNRWRINNALRYRLTNQENAPSIWNAVMLNESLITTGPGPNGVPYEHRTHFLGEFQKRSYVVSVGYMIRYLGVSPEQAVMTHGPIVWLTINFNLKKDTSPRFVDFPEDHSD